MMLDPLGAPVLPRALARACYLLGLDGLPSNRAGLLEASKHALSRLPAHSPGRLVALFASELLLDLVSV